MSDDDFLNEMQGVTPLKQDKASPGKKAVSLDFKSRKDAAENFTQSLDSPFSSLLKKAVLPYDIVGFKRPGVQDGVFRQFRLGKYSIDARLDLHQLSIEKASKAVFSFIKESREYELRTLLIVHGKGDRGDKKALLKNYTLQWLEELPEVLAYHSATPKDGGVGAVYVLLKKSDKAKEKNRERFGLR
ncbi:MAG: DNA endonuclease SmrA [Cellvibrionales bacterium]|nr:DNA endonuclease SmrA [Cellvibrionales bacterium]